MAWASPAGPGPWWPLRSGLTPACPPHNSLARGQRLSSGWEMSELKLKQGCERHGNGRGPCLSDSEARASICHRRRQAQPSTGERASQLPPAPRPAEPTAVRRPRGTAPRTLPDGGWHWRLLGPVPSELGSKQRGNQRPSAPPGGGTGQGLGGAPRRQGLNGA